MKLTIRELTISALQCVLRFGKIRHVSDDKLTRNGYTQCLKRIEMINTVLGSMSDDNKNVAQTLDSTYPIKQLIRLQ